MPAIKVNQEYFASSGRLYGANGLGAVIRGLAIDHARIKIMAADIEDFTDNSTGTNLAGAGLTDLEVPVAAYDATSANGAQRTGFNTAVNVLENAVAVVAQAANTARVKLGLPVLTYAGTVVTPNTIPAITKTVTAATGTSALDYESGRAKMLQTKAHLRRLVVAVDEVFVALGEAKLVSALTGDITSGLALTAVTDADASATGASAISKADADDFLGDFADNIATIAAAWNAVMVQASDTDGLHVVAG